MECKAMEGKAWGVEGRGWLLAGLVLASGCGAAPQDLAPDCAQWPAGRLVLTELLADPEGTDTGKEWLEVHNPGSSPVSLEGLTLYSARLEGSQEKAYLLAQPLQVEPRGFVVLGDVRSEPLPEHVDASYGNGLGALGNSGGRLGLRCGDQVVDEVRYARAARPGLSRSLDGTLTPEATGNDDERHWCDVLPTPGQPNPPCQAAPETTAGPSASSCMPEGSATPRSVVAPRPGELLITEFMADPRAAPDSLGEWIELYALRGVDLNGVSLSTGGSVVSTLQSPRCLHVEAGAYALLARSAEPASNGALPPVLATFSVSLPNATGAHVLRLGLGGTLLDELTWTSAAQPGVAWQLDPADAFNFCLAPEEARNANGDQGTPGEENFPCAQ